MKKNMKTFFNYVVDMIAGAKIEGKKKTYHWGIYSLSFYAPFLVGLLWNLYSILAGVDYGIEYDIVLFGFVVACVLNTYFGIEIGKKLLAKEIDSEWDKIAKSLEDEERN